jgi:HPt (histidine-containing phosphotransfer) domain-containing protein
VSDELLDIFVTEGRELLDQAGQDLLALEQAPDDTGALESLFRAVHTLKGSAGLVGFTAMGELFHAAEDRLVEVRRGELAFDAGLAEGLLNAVWQAERWLDAVARDGQLPPGTEAAGLAAALAPRGAAASSAPGPAPEGQGWADALLTAGPPPPGPCIAFRYTQRADGGGGRGGLERRGGRLGELHLGGHQAEGLPDLGERRRAQAGEHQVALERIVGGEIAERLARRDLQPQEARDRSDDGRRVVAREIAVRTRRVAEGGDVD